MRNKINALCIIVLSLVSILHTLAITQLLEENKKFNSLFPQQDDSDLPLEEDSESSYDMRK